MYEVIITLVLILLVFILWFYRHPQNIVRFNNNKIVYSPAYGKIIKIGNLNDKNLLIAIFLSPYDIHRQYIPIDGIIRNIKYDNTGKFEIAYNYNKSKDNEKMITDIETDHGIMRIYQIAGKIARRITNNLTVGDNVITGDEIGIIHLGSRVDIIIPQSNMFKLLVKEGDYIKGIGSKIGYYIK